ncbi:MAG TPA: hypothetical protein PK490_01830 [Prosthecobacter sp.]|nr:hypothetical protein [Prosthecobacter sp.]HRK12993.1 hypothetical protein [Prosthecobacter sp.]
MAQHSQHKQDSSPACHGGGGQTIVELCRSTDSGLVFWSRQRFEIGSELQIRIHRGALPGFAAKQIAEESDWVTVRGFVVECPAMRRQDGSHGFQVSLLLDAALIAPKPRRPRRARLLPRMNTRFAGLARPGLN